MNRTLPTRPSALVAGLLSVLLTHGATAATDVRVVVTGTVERNDFRSGTFLGVPAGAPVLMQIDLDSSQYLDSPNLPGRTRGYRFNASTFSFSIGSVSANLRANVSTAYFVLRNNDPRTDGVFLSLGTDIDTPIPLAMTPTNYGIAFSRTFGNIPPTGPDPTLPSLNLLECLGSWGQENLAAFNFNVELNEFSTPLIITYQTLAISRLCTPEFNNDGVLNADDLGDFISCLFSPTPCPRADFNADSTTNADDLGDFITAYFLGC